MYWIRRFIVIVFIKLCYDDIMDALNRGLVMNIMIQISVSVDNTPV